eukprot:3642269-Pleurochrysis_carterae.AAC.4
MAQLVATSASVSSTMIAAATGAFCCAAPTAQLRRPATSLALEASADYRLHGGRLERARLIPFKRACVLTRQRERKLERRAAHTAPQRGCSYGARVQTWMLARLRAQLRESTQRRTFSYVLTTRADSGGAAEGGVGWGPWMLGLVQGCREQG